MKAIHLFYGFFGVLLALAISSDPVRSDDDGYVKIDPNGHPIAPTPKPRHRQMPTPIPKPTLDPQAPPIPDPHPLPPVHYKKVRESDEARTARVEQKTKDAKLKNEVKARLNQVNRLRLKLGLNPMSSTSCKDGMCNFDYKEGGTKINCSGSVDSFLIDASPGFNCGGQTCFLNASNGIMECGGAPNTTTPPQPTARPDMPGDPRDCEIDPNSGLEVCPHGPGGPVRKAQEAI